MRAIAWAASTASSLTSALPASARKAESTARKTPIAITVVGGNELTNQARNGADDAPENVPGVEVQGASPN